MKQPVAGTGSAVHALLEELTKDIPAEDWDSLPPDLSEHFEEYEYGNRTWPTKG
jgi:hypothetical protein